MGKSCPHVVHQIFPTMCPNQGSPSEVQYSYLILTGIIPSSHFALADYCCLELIHLSTHPFSNEHRVAKWLKELLEQPIRQRHSLMWCRDPGNDNTNTPVPSWFFLSNFCRANKW